MVFWTLVSLFRGNRSPLEAGSPNANGLGPQTQTTTGIVQTRIRSRLSFERRSVYAFSLVSTTNTFSTSRIRASHWIEPIITPTVKEFENIMKFLSPKDAVKLLFLCNSWSGPAAEAFYAIPPIRGDHGFPQLITLLARNDTLHPYPLLIRELVIAGVAADELLMGDLKNCLIACTNLVSLRIEHCNHLSSLVAIFLSEHAPFLSRIELPGCQVNDSFLISMIRGVKSLVHIDVSFTNVTLSALPILVRECEHLETIVMAGCLPSPKQDIVSYENSEYVLVGDALKKYKNFSLKEVDVSNTMISDAIMRYSVCHCVAIEALILDTCPALSDDAINCIALHCPNLKMLNVSQCNITDISLQALAIHLSAQTGALLQKSDHFPPMDSTRSSYSSFSEYNEIKTANNRQMQLKSLVLSGCRNISQKGVLFLASKCPDLETIVLDGCVRVTEWYYQDCQVSPATLEAVAARHGPLSESDTESFVSALSEIDMTRAVSVSAAQSLSVTPAQLISRKNSI